MNFGMNHIKVYIKVSIPNPVNGIWCSLINSVNFGNLSTIRGGHAYSRVNIILYIIISQIFLNIISKFQILNL